MGRGVKPDPPKPPADLPEGIVHGSFRAHQAYGCRCVVCQTFMRRKAKEYRAKRTGYIPGNALHGTLYVYNHHGCRCGPCCEVRRLYDRTRYSLGNLRKDKTRKGRVKYRQGPWYVCVDNGRRYDWHDYLNGQCLRCDAKQAVEELWERKWNESCEQSSGEPS